MPPTENCNQNGEAFLSADYRATEWERRQCYAYPALQSGRMDAAMSLATVLTTLTNLSTWYGQRTGSNGLWLLDVARNQHHNLCQTASIRNLGLEHFYAAFGLGCSRDLRTSSARAFGIRALLVNSHSEKGQDWPASNRSATIGGGKRGKQSELLWLWGLV